MVTLLVVLGLLVALVALAVVLAARADRRDRVRDTALIRLATERGWHYEPRNRDYRDRFLGVPFCWTRSADITNIVTGVHRDRYLFACDFRYAMVVGTTTEEVTYSVVAVAMPNIRPGMEITNRAGKVREGTKLGRRDNPLGDAAFDAVFRVRTDDQRFAAAVLHPPLRQFLLGDQRGHRWPVRFERADLVTWERGTLDANKLLWMLDYLVDVADRVPVGV